MEQDTALVKVNPLADPAIVSLHTQAIRFIDAAAQLVIASDAEVTSATGDLSLISHLKRAIEDKRKEYTQPLNNHLKDINDAFKTFTEPITDADKLVRRKILDYRAELDRQHREAEEIERLKQEAAEREAALTGQPLIQPEPTSAIPAPPDQYHAQNGTLGKVTIRKWELEDFSKVPDEYKTIDTVTIGKVVRAGIPSIPGIRIWQEDTLRIDTE